MTGPTRELSEAELRALYPPPPAPPPPPPAASAPVAVPVAGAIVVGRLPTGEQAINCVLRGWDGRRRAIAIPEWPDATGQPLVLYFGPMTEAEYRFVTTPEMQARGMTERWIAMLIHKAELENGSLAFERGHADYLSTKALWPVIQRVVDFMYAAGKEGEATQPATDPTSGRSVGSPSPSASPPAPLTP